MLGYQEKKVTAVMHVQPSLEARWQSAEAPASSPKEPYARLISSRNPHLGLFALEQARSALKARAQSIFDAHRGAKSPVMLSFSTNVCCNHEEKK